LIQDSKVTQSSFALVHGAWHGGWAWDALKVELEARGHRVVAPDMPCEDVDAGVAEYASVVLEGLGAADDAIVVGHSLGGMTIPLVPARMHVYLCAYVPQPGRALIDRGSDAFGPGFADTAVRDELERSYWPDPVAAARDLQYPPGSEALATRLRRQARKPSIEPSALKAMPTAPSAYIVCTRDRAVPPEWQRHIARSELGGRVFELASGHSPMLTHTEELAEILDRLAVNDDAIIAAGKDHQTQPS
jgi:pimeloyl-ACP methyl ester carboxylesterase